VNLETLMPLAVFGAVTSLSWLLMIELANRKPRTVQRLDELKNPALRRGNRSGALVRKPDSLAKVLATTGALTKSLQPKSEADIGKLRARLAAAGFRSEVAGPIFMGIKLTGLLAALFIGGGAIVGFRGVQRSDLTWTAAVVALGFYLPDVIVGWLARRRKQAIFLALPDALDMLVVCVEAGLGLDQAMRKVSDEMKESYRILAEEFSITNFQLQMGRTRSEALHELGVRTGVADLRSLAGVIIQADKFGTSIAQALRVQSESMRIRRRQIAEEKAAKTAVKLIFPLVIFIFPGIFVVLVGPAAINMVRQMFPKMNGQ
jgi:tight adherence protein C